MGSVICVSGSVSCVCASLNIFKFTNGTINYVGSFLQSGYSVTLQHLKHRKHYSSLALASGGGVLSALCRVCFYLFCLGMIRRQIVRPHRSRSGEESSPRIRNELLARSDTKSAGSPLTRQPEHTHSALARAAHNRPNTAPQPMG